MRQITVAGIFAIIIQFFTFCKGNSLLFHDGYNVKGNKVYYKKSFPGGTFEITGVDIASFKIVHYSETDNNKLYATDKNNVYYSGYAIAGSNGSTFTLLNENFAKDKNQCYYNGGVITHADPASFTIKDKQFSADKQRIYKRTLTIDNDPSIFESYDSGFLVRTANAVSVFESIVPIPSGEKFYYIQYDYYSLGSQLYFQNKPMPGADIKNFKAYDRFFSATSQHVYYADRIIVHANPATFTLLQAPYGKDDRHVFFFEKTIDGADPHSFEILNTAFQCGRDKNWAYHENKRIKNVTTADMNNKSVCRQCNEERIYFVQQ